MPLHLSRRALRTGGTALAAALAGAVALAAPAVAAPPGPARTEPAAISVDTHGPASGDATPFSADLHRWAADTWHSLDAMTDPAVGLPADNIDGSLDPASASGHTSPTNVGGYLWSTLAARGLGIISADEARDRLTTTIGTLEHLERNAASGMFYNWYSPADGQKLTTWPEDGSVVHPFLSTVDNGWLAAALRMVANGEPTLTDRARALYDSMDFGVFFDPTPYNPHLPAGTNKGGFWEEQPGDTCASERAPFSGSGPNVFYTCHWYDTTVSESRIATYLGIVNGQIPPTGLYGTFRTMPAGCDYAWQEQSPVGEDRVYGGLTVYEGAYRYDGMRFVPSWGGSMFEALMPDLLVPEEDWGPTSWGVNHPVTVAVQEKHGQDAGYGYWGFSPASNPDGGYREYGVDAAGMRADGYFSDQENTDVDLPFEGCPTAERGTNPTPTYGDGVVTPHASFLALGYDAHGAVENLRGIERDLHAYGPGGFYDAVAVHSGRTAERYLSLDQSMIMAAVANGLDHGAMRTLFADDAVRDSLQPLMAAQTFSAAWAPRSAAGGGVVGEGAEAAGVVPASIAAGELAATGSRVGGAAVVVPALAVLFVGAGITALAVVRRRRRIG
ncbi:glucoamylase family protein [Leifsonia aquatica]|uniref:glucoamylase family protein n=1 Tax=Leifsonia aquatica TaxID=144185 RepID=UPI000469AFD4|nr:glucoamylase family protein [Leifsonia aquatica]